jgi:uncharacterized protein DUF5916
MTAITCTPSTFALMTRLTGCLVLLLASFHALSNGVPETFVKKTDAKITLDGVLDEEIWQQATVTTDFWQYFPTDSVISEYRTEVYMVYTKDKLYIAARCYAPGREYIVPSLRRDFRAGGNDNITFMFDTFNDGANAFVFGMNPYGVRREALITEGGSSFNNFQSAWDNKWDGEAVISDDYWTVEMAIPFKTLRFNSGSQNWRFNAYRFDTQANEIMTWVRIPRNQSIINLAFMGNMKWEEPLKKSGPNISLIPYVSGLYSKDYEVDPDKSNWKPNFGGDAKVAVTPGLNLDLTFNPDFSQVEVDQQVTNITRFEIFFPERRQFFLENSDLFGAFGSSEINPFFSRRIGLVADTSTGTNIANPIPFGVRLNGKVSDDWRIGLLNMTTQQDQSNGLPTFNYSVAAVQKKLFSRSNIGVIFVNKQAFNPQPTDLFDSYNRMFGIDYNLQSSDNKWVGKAFVHKVFAENEKEATWANGARMEYRVRKYRATMRYEYVGKNYNPQVGFVLRNDFVRLAPAFGIFFYPAKGAINTFEVSAETNVLYKPGFGRSDQDTRLSLNGTFQESGRFGASLAHRYTYLFKEFDPTRSGGIPLPDSTDYNDVSFTLSYSSDARKKFSYRVRGGVGEFFDGFRVAIAGSASYRYQPYGSVGINYTINYIALQDPHPTSTLFIIGPRVDLTISRKLFFNALVQYNSQIDNININARLQWRFKPVSDFFLVYTDNYGTEGLGIKNRSIVAKVTYWLNI